MRCPHCAGEIPKSSRFCGICGRNITLPPTGVPAPLRRPMPADHGPPDDGSRSLFELPVSRGARLARIFVILALDLVLAGAGLAMIFSYLGERKRARDAGPPVEERAGGAVEALVPELAPPEPPEPPEEADTAGADPEPKQAGGRRAGGPRAPERPRPAGSGPPAGSGRPGQAAAAGSAPPPSPGGAQEPPERPRGDTAGAGGSGGAGEQAGGTGEGEEEAAGDEPSDEEVLGVQRRVALAVQRHELQLERCYQQAAKASSPDDPVGGRIDIRLTVMPDGTAANVRAVNNSTGSQQLARCVSGLVESFAFGHGASQPLEFVWPFLFKPPGNR